MIRNLVRILAVVAVLVIALLLYAGTRPSDFSVSRSSVVQAPPDKIYPLVADFHRWAEWSPYEKLDPAMTRRFEGAANGKGAAYAWSSEGKAGAGRMEIVDATPPRQLDIRLDFTRPLEGHNLARFVFAPDGAATRVTWTMSGPSPFVAKVAGIFVDMDHLIGGDFDTGLAQLKAIAER